MATLEPLIHSLMRSANQNFFTIKRRGEVWTGRPSETRCADGGKIPFGPQGCIDRPRLRSVSPQLGSQPYFRQYTSAFGAGQCN